MNKKGISMVALVITIIVLIILTGAVIITGVNAPQAASDSVRAYNETVVQDAVTIYIMNKIVANSASVAAGTYDVSTAVAELYTGSAWTTGAATALNLSAEVLTGLTVDENGKVTDPALD